MNKKEETTHKLILIDRLTKKPLDETEFTEVDLQYLIKEKRIQIFCMDCTREDLHKQLREAS